MKRGYRKRARRQGLVPSYHGWQPRQFQLGEWKYVDTVFNPDVNTTMAYQSLNVMQLGNTASTRVGQKIAVRSIELRIQVRPTAATGVEQFGRFIVVLDRQPNAAAPAAATDFMAAATTTSPRALTNRKRFKFLLDRSYALGSVVAGTNTSTPTSRYYHIYMKLRRPIIVEFNAANNGTVADISTNHIFYTTVGSEAAGNTDSISQVYLS